MYLGTSGLVQVSEWVGWRKYLRRREREMNGGRMGRRVQFRARRYRLGQLLTRGARGWQWGAATKSGAGPETSTSATGTCTSLHLQLLQQLLLLCSSRPGAVQLRVGGSMRRRAFHPPLALSTAGKTWPLTQRGTWAEKGCRQPPWSIAIRLRALRSNFGALDPSQASLRSIIQSMDHSIISFHGGRPPLGHCEPPLPLTDGFRQHLRSLFSCRTKALNHEAIASC
jgi:hypothetical protein